MSFKRLSTLFPHPDSQACTQLERFGPVLNKTIPLRGKHLSTLPYGIRDLSRMLTDERGEISKDYMGQPATRAAYLRYFLPWNLYRLIRLLQGLRLELQPDALIGDLGSGPLTFPLALWMAQPELRELPLRLVCVDRTPSIMRDGLALFRALTKDKSPWKFDLVKGPMHAGIRGGADLLVAANALNELQWGPGGSMPAQAERLAGSLRKGLSDQGRLLVVEPGTRRSGTILSHLREQFIELGMLPLAPCPHFAKCPMNGLGIHPWCHFKLPVMGAPEWLEGLSRRAGLPKSDASISFLLLGRDAPEQQEHVRAISNVFAVPGGTGQYACAEQGMVLLRYESLSRAGWPGDLLEVEWPQAPEHDEKSGAPILPVTWSSEAPKTEKTAPKAPSSRKTPRKPARPSTDKADAKQNKPARKPNRKEGEKSGPQKPAPKRGRKSEANADRGNQQQPGKPSGPKRAPRPKKK